MLLEPDLAVITHKTFNILYLYILTLMNKVVILTDNPKRDLMGNLLLSLELLKKILRFLTPFNLTEKEILNIEPDIIIFNYLRFQNSKLILLAIKKNKVVVLDTEGGAFENDKDFTNSIYYKKDYDKNILYLCKLYESYLKKFLKWKLLLQDILDLIFIKKFKFI